MSKFLMDTMEMLPMQYIMKAMLAIILALLMNYIYISIISHQKKPTDKEIMKHIKVNWSVKNVVATSLKNGRRYSLDGSRLNKRKLSRRERKQRKSKEKA